MKTLIKTISPDTKLFGLGNITTSQKPAEEEITNSIIDSFNDQVYLGKQFKTNILRTLGTMEFAYPNDAIKIQKEIDSFLASSHELLGDYMKTILDLYLAFKPDTMNEAKDTRQTSSFAEGIVKEHNGQWAQDWIEQTAFLKNHHSVSALFEGNADDFCYYMDASVAD